MQTNFTLAQLADPQLQALLQGQDAQGRQTERLERELREAASRHGVDAELIKAIIAVESGYQRGAVSPRGALGLMQITPETASRYATPADAARLIELAPEQQPAQQRDQLTQRAVRALRWICLPANLMA